MKLVLPYVAGIIDGEGTISLIKRLQGGSHPAPYVSVHNTNFELIDTLQKQFGGRAQRHKPSKVNHRVAYSWRLHNNDALGFLKKINRYLLIKKPQADLLLRDYKRVTHPAGKYSQELLKAKQGLLDQMRLLNKRGM